ncbi:MAG: hypothetical protein AAFQ57_16895 [Cyanobacteria bacterium J06626_14]
MTDDSDIGERIRAHIRPFEHEVRYPVGWDDPLTFEEIRDSLTPNINRLMRYYRYVNADIPDMIAHGFMRLWEELSDNPDLLAEKDHGGAVKWVMHRSNNSHYRKFYRREMYREDFATRSGYPDEFLIDGYGHRYQYGHADFAEAVDLRIDIERAVQELAEKYQDSLPHLAALYYITTSVKPDDAAEIAGRGGTKKSWWLTSIVKPMRTELAEILDIHMPKRETWQDKFRAGDEDPLRELITDYNAQGKTQLSAVVESLSRFEDCRTLMEELGVNKGKVHRLRYKAHQALNDAYGCRR